MARTQAQIEADIASLNAAKLQLGLGTKTASVSYDGRSVTYTQTDIGKINGLIMELQMELASIGAGPVRRRSFPIQF